MSDPSVKLYSPSKHENTDQVTSEESWEPMSIFYYYYLQDNS